MLQRDVFIEEISKHLNSNKHVYFLSADFGAAALDELRKNFPDNFIHCGICEQGMLDIATGLALEGKSVFCYAMAPFLSLRAIEQLKCGPGMMNLPVCLISVGVGLGYADSGPTHYATEDFAAIRSIVNSSIYSASDSVVARDLANKWIANPHPAYVRLDRHDLPDLQGFKTMDGFRVLGDNNNIENKAVLISHGKMVHTLVDIYSKDQEKFLVIDLINSKPVPDNLMSFLSNCKFAYVVDEQTPNGSLLSAVLEFCSIRRLTQNVFGKNLDDIYIFENGGREHLIDKYGLSQSDMEKDLGELFCL